MWKFYKWKIHKSTLRCDQVRAGRTRHVRTCPCLCLRTKARQALTTWPRSGLVLRLFLLSPCASAGGTWTDGANKLHNFSSAHKPRLIAFEHCITYKETIITTTVPFLTNLFDFLLLKVGQFFVSHSDSGCWPVRKTSVIFYSMFSDYNLSWNTSTDVILLNCLFLLNILGNFVCPLNILIR